MKFEDVVYALLHDPALVIVTGHWRTGKRDFSLLIAEAALKLGIIDKVASNIKADGVKFIRTLNGLESWARANTTKKLYILYGMGLYYRGPSNLHRALIALLPQCSELHLRIIVIVHSPTEIDYSLRSPVWCRGEIQKVSLKNAIIKSPLLVGGALGLHDIPPTSLSFDPNGFTPFKIPTRPRRKKK